MFLHIENVFNLFSLFNLMYGKCNGFTYGRFFNLMFENGMVSHMVVFVFNLIYEKHV